MLLYIIRHAAAGEHGDPRFPDDNLRPLTKQGKKRFRQVVEKLGRRGVDVQVVATSPLVRCRQTAEIFCEHLPSRPRLLELPELAPGSQLPRLVAWTITQQASSVAWVGHAPDVGQLAAQLIGNQGDSGLRFAKGAVAEIKFPEAVAAGQGELQWLVTARLLGA